MNSTEHDASDQKLRDLITIRSYLRDRRDELHEQKKTEDAWAIAREVLLLNEAITKAKARVRTVTFDQQKREAIAAAKHLVEILGDVCDESPATTADERRFLHDALNRIKAARVLVLSILDSQDNPE